MNDNYKKLLVWVVKLLFTHFNNNKFVLLPFM